MAERNNIIAEIQKMVQQIEKDYREGIDYQFVAKSLINRSSGGVRVKILSPKLKIFCREKFDLPPGDIELDFEKGDSEGNDFYYRIFKSGFEYDILDCAKGKLYRFSHDKEEPKKCKGCGELASFERGRIAEWSRGIEPNLKIIAYFHPECAKKYFAGKEQLNQKNISHLKENLDKISFDQAGHLANAELLKLPYEYGTQSKEKAGVYRIKIDNEVINLRDFDRLENKKYYFEIRDAIVNNIKQNISDYEIKKDEYNSDYLENKKNGVKVWKIIFDELVFENGEKDWAEIEKLLKGYNSPAVNNEKTGTNNFELRWLRNIFQELRIKKVVFENGKLTIEFNNSQKTSFENDDNRKYKILKNYCQKYHKKEITREQLFINRNLTNTSNFGLEDKYLLAWGISFGTIILLFILYGWRKKAKVK